MFHLSLHLESKCFGTGFTKVQSAVANISSRVCTRTDVANDVSGTCSRTVVANVSGTVSANSSSGTCNRMILTDFSSD